MSSSSSKKRSNPKEEEKEVQIIEQRPDYISVIKDNEKPQPCSLCEMGVFASHRVNADVVCLYCIFTSMDEKCDLKSEAAKCCRCNIQFGYFVFGQDSSLYRDIICEKCVTSVISEANEEFKKYNTHKAQKRQKKFDDNIIELENILDLDI
jgi:hypothetical protein